VTEHKIPIAVAYSLAALVIFVNLPHAFPIQVPISIATALPLILTALTVPLLLLRTPFYARLLLGVLVAKLGLSLVQFGSVGFLTASPIAVLTIISNPNVILLLLQGLFAAAASTPLADRLFKEEPEASSTAATTNSPAQQMAPRIRKRTTIELTALAVLALLAIGWAFIQPYLQDRKLVADLIRYGNQERAAIESGKLSTIPKNIEHTLNASGILLCATFNTDASGKPPASGRHLSGQYSEADISKHHKGSQCFLFKVDKARAIKRDTAEWHNQLVTRITSTSFSTLSLDVRFGSLSEIRLNQVKIVNDQGAEVDRSLLRPGNVVSLYYQYDVLTGTHSIYKATIDSSSLDPKLCEQILHRSDLVPVASCPETTHGLTLTSISTDNGQIMAQIHAGSKVKITWEGPAPKAINSAGTLSGFKVGDNVDLILSATTGAVEQIALR
jgi:hypothetical protein